MTNFFKHKVRGKSPGEIARWIILGIIAPKDYEVNREIDINKSLSEVFSYLKLLKNR